MIPEVKIPVPRLADSPGAADAIDGPQVVLVPRFRQSSFIEIHAQAGAEHGLFNVMGRQGVAGEQDVDVAASADEPADDSPLPV